MRAAYANNKNLMRENMNFPYYVPDPYSDFLINGFRYGTLLLKYGI
jgi:hypothetical protein